MIQFLTDVRSTCMSAMQEFSVGSLRIGSEMAVLFFSQKFSKAGQLMVKAGQLMVRVLVLAFRVKSFHQRTHENDTCG